MNYLTIALIIIPLIFSFFIFFTGKFGKYLAIITCLFSLIFSLFIFSYFSEYSYTFSILDTFGVTFLLDSLSAYFIFTNSIVTITIIIYCWQSDKRPYFFAQIILLHQSLNSAFIIGDLISLYVALEVIGMISFLLITYPRQDKCLWIGLRYLAMSNVAMLFYLLGVILVYKANNSLLFEGLNNSPPEALVLILIALFVKSGVFICGFWLPLTHQESDTAVSALMVITKASILPLIRFASFNEEVEFILQIVGVATATLGLIYALLEKDIRRLLAFSTISQLGFILASPAVAGFYTLSHGLAKSTLFLTAGSLPSTNLSQLRQTRIHTSLWIPLTTASLSVMGFPFLFGFTAKILTMENLLSWQVIPMNILAVGTIIYLTRLILLPHQFTVEKKISSNLLASVSINLAILVIIGGFFLSVYTFENVIKALITIVLGFFVYYFIFKEVNLKVSRFPENFDNLVGFMTIIAVLIYTFILILDKGYGG